MTTSELVFDPFSEEFFNGPWEIYRRMREEAPVYYNSEHDFYALSRHEDVSAAYKDFATYSSAYGLDLATVRSEEPMAAKMIILMDPPEHRQMRSLVNKVFTPRAIEAMKPMVTETIDRYLTKVDPERFDVVQDFSAFFPVEVITQMLGVPEEYRQQVREWVDISLHREPGQIDMSEEGMQAIAESMALYYKLIQERRAEPLRRHVQSPRRRRDRARGRREGVPRRLRDRRFCNASGRRGRRDGHQAGRQRSGDICAIPQSVAEAARRPQQDPRRGGGTAALRAAGALQRAKVHARGGTARGNHSGGQAGVPAGGSAHRDPGAFTDADTFDIDRDRTEAQNLGFGYGVHSCLGAALARMESAIALDRLLDFMPRYEVMWDDCKRVAMQNVAGWSHVPVRLLR